MAWLIGWRIDWQRFRYWDSQIGFEKAYYKLSAEKKSIVRQGITEAIH